MGNSKLVRVDTDLVKAIEDLQKNLEKNLGLRISFTKASKKLAELYWNCKLEFESEKKEKDEPLFYW